MKISQYLCRGIFIVRLQKLFCLIWCRSCASSSTCYRPSLRSALLITRSGPHMEGFPRGLESLEKPWIWKNKLKAWNSLENGQIGLRALKIFKSALKFSKILKFPPMFAPHPDAWLCTSCFIFYFIFYLWLAKCAHSYQCQELCAHYRSSLYNDVRTVSEDEVNLLNTALTNVRQSLRPPALLLAALKICWNWPWKALLLLWPNPRKPCMGSWTCSI